MDRETPTTSNTTPESEKSDMITDVMQDEETQMNSNMTPESVSSPESHMTTDVMQDEETQTTSNTTPESVSSPESHMITDVIQDEETQTSNTTPESDIQEDTGSESGNILSSIHAMSSLLDDNATTFKDLDTKQLYLRELVKFMSCIKFITSDNDTISSSEKSDMQDEETQTTNTTPESVSSSESHMITDVIQDKQIDNDLTAKESIFFNRKKTIIVRAIIESKKFDDYDESSDTFADTEEDVIKYIEDLMMCISKKTNNWSDTIKYRFNRILFLSDRKFAAYYLVKHNVLQEMLKAAYTKPDLIEIVFYTIIMVCRHEYLISSIGKNLEFAKLILTHLKSIHDSILLCTLRFINIAVLDIQRDHNSCWLIHLKTCEFFEHCVTTIFKLQFNEALITAVTDLVRDIAVTILLDHDQPILLKQLFNLQHNLIPVLMTSCMQMIISKKNKMTKDKKMNFVFVEAWLSIMTSIRMTGTDLATVFGENEERDKYTFLKILFMMLHPYQETVVFSSPRREINLTYQDFDVIVKCVSLLSYIHQQFYVPLKMDGILMKVILYVKTVAESKPRSLYNSSIELVRDFLTDRWLCIVKYRTCLHIAKSIKQFDQKDREYFLKLLKTESHPLLRKRMKMIKDKLKETQIRKKFNV